jgi:multiple sugar transport system substrate-binding protein
MTRKAMFSLVGFICLASIASGCVPSPAPPTATADSAAAPEPGGPGREPTGSEATPAGASRADPEARIPIRWFIGLEGGMFGARIAVKEAVAAAFNNSQDRIELKLEIIPHINAAEWFSEEIADGNGPDLVGPLSWAESHAFEGQWLDISPLLESEGFDDSIFHPALMDMYETSEGRAGLPFAVYPSALFFAKGLFQKAGLNFPPAAYGEPYTLPDGTVAEWNWETLAAIARRLTVDAAGKNSTEPGFQKDQIVQYGYTWQFEQHPNFWGSYFAGGSMLAPDGKTAQAPDAWVDAWKWTYAGIWGAQPFIPDQDVEGGNQYGGGNPFNSGRVAMTVGPVWYTCCMKLLRDWEAAAMPSYRGEVGGRIDGETFRIWKGTRHPQAAFAVLKYLVTEGARPLIFGTPDLPAHFGPVPALTSLQDEWLESGKLRFPWVKNWQVVLAGLDYPDLPGAERYVPNYSEAWSRGESFAKLLRTSARLNLDREIAVYLADLNLIFSR